MNIGGKEIEFSELPPDFVLYNGIKYRIRSDFRTWIRFEKLVQSRQSAFDIICQALSLCYLKELPPSADAAFALLIEFYTGEKLQHKHTDSAANTADRKRIYDFEYDAQYIYSAFLHDYGIDLCTAQLHWWHFKALFISLSDSNRITEIMNYRGTDTSKIKDKAQKQLYVRMKRRFKLPDMRTQQQKDEDMIRVLTEII